MEEDGRMEEWKIGDLEFGVLLSSTSRTRRSTFWARLATRAAPLQLPVSCKDVRHTKMIDANKHSAGNIGQP